MTKLPWDPLGHVRRIIAADIDPNRHSWLLNLLRNKVIMPIDDFKSGCGKKEDDDDQHDEDRWHLNGQCGRRPGMASVQT
jgi:hypothetical protein